MVGTGKIKGEQLVNLFDQVIESKTLLSMHLMGSQYEQLTHILRMDILDRQPLLIIDAPKDFNKAVADTKPWHLRFNFNGPDKLEYIFHTRGGYCKGRDLYIPLPDCVERIQRRKNFRIDTPVGTYMRFTANKKELAIALSNISMGGAYGSLVAPKAKAFRRPFLKVDKYVYKITLIFPADQEMEAQTIMIKKAKVRRVEHISKKKIYKYAFEFIDIDPLEKEKLTRSIYHIQRQFLQRH